MKALAIGGVGTVGSVGTAGLVNALTPRLFPEERVFERNTGYWSRALPPPLPPLTADAEFDVVIVGGGFTGLSCAYYVRKLFPGKRVAVLVAPGRAPTAAVPARAVPGAGAVPVVAPASVPTVFESWAD